MSNTVLISSDNGEIRVAIFENSKLVEYYRDSEDNKNFVGNIYKGRVTGVVSGLQAAFVDINVGKNTFLHLQDINIDLVDGLKKTKKPTSKATTGGGKSRKSISIEDILSVGQDIMIQVSKEEIKDKGPRATTNISLPGRYLVLLPFQEGKGGISKKIEDTDERRRLREVLREVKARKVGFIVRTAGVGHDVTKMKTDANMLVNQWNIIARKFKTASSPSLLYNDHDIIYRLIRDIFSESIDEIYIDDAVEYKKMGRLLDKFIPALSPRLILYHSQTRLFDKFEVNKEINRAIKRKIWLKSGGYLIIDEAEALTAIDVNTGRFTGKKDQEKTIVKTNLEAAQLVAQLLRLRDIGGIIVIDFIDMSTRENKHKVLEAFKQELKKDRTKLNVSGISEFGLVEMTRKRVRGSLKNFMFTDCPYCLGSGQILTNKEIVNRITHSVEAFLYEVPRPEKLRIIIHPDLKQYIGSNCPALFSSLRRKTRILLDIVESQALPLGRFEIHRVEEVEKIEEVEKVETPQRPTSHRRIAKPRRVQRPKGVVRGAETTTAKTIAKAETVAEIPTKPKTADDDTAKVDMSAKITRDERVPTRASRHKQDQRPKRIVRGAETTTVETDKSIKKVDEVDKIETTEPVKKVDRPKRLTRRPLRRTTRAKKTEKPTPPKSSTDS